MQDLNEEEIKELKLEKDDPNELTRMRKMDDWKDGNMLIWLSYLTNLNKLSSSIAVHKRGEGNRHNMG